MLGHASGVTSASPRWTASRDTPRRLSATRATGPTLRVRLARRSADRGSPPIACGARRAGPAGRRRPSVPAASVPVTTVPAPVMVKERSTHSRTRAVVSGGGSCARTRSRAAPNSVSPLPSTADTMTPGASRNPVSDISSRACSRTFAATSSGARSARVITMRPYRIPNAASASRWSLDCACHPSSAATTKQTTGAGPRPARVLPRKRWWPGTSTNATSRPDAKRGPGEAEIDGQPATTLLLPTVGLHAGEGPDEGALAVVDVAGGGNDIRVRGLQRSSRSRASASRTAPSRRSSSDSGMHRRSSRHTPSCTRGSTAGSPARRGPAADSGRRTAHPGRGTPGAPPPPTRPSCATTDAPTAVGESLGPGAQPFGIGVQRLGHRRSAGAEGRLERGEGEFVGAHRARQRMPRHPGDHVRAAEHDARLRAAEQLVTAGGDDVGAFGQRARRHRAHRAAVGRARAARCRGLRPRALCWPRSAPEGLAGRRLS